MREIQIEAEFDVIDFIQTHYAPWVKRPFDATHVVLELGKFHAPNLAGGG
jgi:hypothetical protein